MVQSKKWGLCLNTVDAANRIVSERSPQKNLGSRDAYTNTHVHPKLGMKIPALRSAQQTLPRLGTGMPAPTGTLAKGNAWGTSEPLRHYPQPLSL